MLFSDFPPSLARFIRSRLHRALPPPFEDTHEAWEDRNLAAMAAIARLTPMNTGEALLAVQAIAAEAHASDVLESASQHRDDVQLAAKFRAQSAQMIRQAMQVRKELRITQAERREAERWHAEEMEREAARGEPAAQPDTVPPSSQTMGQNPTTRSYETDLGGFPRFGAAPSLGSRPLPGLPGAATGLFPPRPPGPGLRDAA